MSDNSVVSDRFGLNWQIFLFSSVVHLVALALPLALLQVYDRIIPNQSTATVAFLFIGVGIAIFFEALLRYGRARVLAGVGARFDASTPVDMLRRMLAAELPDTDRQGSARLMEAFRSVSAVRDFWSGNAAIGLYEVPFVLIYVVLIYLIGGPVALVPAAIIVLAIAIGVAARVSVARASSDLEESDTERRNFLWALLSGLALAKLSGGERKLASQYASRTAESMSRAARVDFYAAMLRESGAALGQLSTVLVVAFGAVLVMDGSLTTGGLAACSILAGRSMGPALAGIGYVVRIGQVREAQQRIENVLSLPGPDTGHASAGWEETETGLLVETENGERIAVRPGEIVEISGEPVECLSDFMKVAAGLQSMAGTRVSLDGQSLDDLSTADLRARVAYVPDRSVILPGSVLNNLTLFDPRYNESARNLSNRLGLNSHFDKMRHGVLTNIGGVASHKLDDGLVQRIGLVRALVRRPSVLLLDDADFALDLDGEKRFVELLKDLKPEMGILIRSSRPAVRDACDRKEKVGGQ